MPSLRVLLAGVVVAALVAGCGADSTTGDTADPSSTALAAGPVPNPPSPLRHDALVATAGSSIVVFGGVTDSADGERGVPVEGGLMLDPTAGWKPLTGNSGIQGGLVRAGAVDTGKELLILGTECDESWTEFSRANPDLEDESPCRGKPLRFFAVDPVTKTMRPLPAPNPAYEDPERASYSSHPVNSVGWSSEGAVFNVSEGATDITMVYDTADGEWSTLPHPNPPPTGQGTVGPGNAWASPGRRSWGSKAPNPRIRAHPAAPRRGAGTTGDSGSHSMMSKCRSAP